MFHQRVVDLVLLCGYGHLRASAAAKYDLNCGASGSESHSEAAALDYSSNQLVK